MFSKPRNIIIKAIAIALIASFITYDIAWAYPDYGRNLAVPGLQNKDTVARIDAGLVCLEIEKRGIKDLRGIVNWYLDQHGSDKLDGIKLKLGKDELLLVFAGSKEGLAIRYSQAPDGTLSREILKGSRVTALLETFPKVPPFERTGDRSGIIAGTGLRLQPEPSLRMAAGGRASQNKIPNGVSTAAKLIKKVYAGVPDNKLPRRWICALIAIKGGLIEFDVSSLHALLLKAGFDFGWKKLQGFAYDSGMRVERVGPGRFHFTGIAIKKAKEFMQTLVKGKQVLGRGAASARARQVNRRSQIAEPKDRHELIALEDILLGEATEDARVKTGKTAVTIIGHLLDRLDLAGSDAAKIGLLLRIAETYGIYSVEEFERYSLKKKGVDLSRYYRENGFSGNAIIGDLVSRIKKFLPVYEGLCQTEPEVLSLILNILVDSVSGELTRRAKKKLGNILGINKTDTNPASVKRAIDGSYTRFSVLKLLKDSNFKKRLSELSESLKGKDSRTRLEALKEVEGMAAEAAPLMPVLAGIFSDEKDPVIRLNILKTMTALDRIGRQTRPILKAILTNQKETRGIRLLAIQAAGKIAAVGGVVRGLGNPIGNMILNESDNELRIQAVRFLRSSGIMPPGALKQWRAIADNVDEPEEICIFAYNIVASKKDRKIKSPISNVSKSSAPQAGRDSSSGGYPNRTPAIKDADELSGYIDKMKESKELRPLFELLFQRITEDFDGSEEFIDYCKGMLYQEGIFVLTHALNKADEPLRLFRKIRRKIGSESASIAFYGILLFNLTENATPYLDHIYKNVIKVRHPADISLARKGVSYLSRGDSVVRLRIRNALIGPSEPYRRMLAARPWMKPPIDQTGSDNSGKVRRAMELWSKWAPSRFENFQKKGTVIELSLPTYTIFSDPDHNVARPIHIGMGGEVLYFSKKYLDELTLENNDDMLELVFWLDFGQQLLELHEELVMAESEKKDAARIQHRIVDFNNHFHKRIAECVFLKHARFRARLADFMRQDTLTTYADILPAAIQEEALIRRAVQQRKDIGGSIPLEELNQHRDTLILLFSCYIGLGLRSKADGIFAMIKETVRELQRQDPEGLLPIDSQRRLMMMALRFGYWDDFIKELRVFLSGEGFGRRLLDGERDILRTVVETNASELRRTLARQAHAAMPEMADYVRKIAEEAEELLTEYLQTGTIAKPGAERKSLSGGTKRDELAGLIAPVIGEQVENIKEPLQSLDDAVLEHAVLKRFNLESPKYQIIFKEAWLKGPADAVRNLAKGYVTRHILDEHGQLYLNSLPGDIEAAQWSINLSKAPIYHSSRNPGETVQLEWAYYPQIGFWLPVLASMSRQNRRQVYLKAVLDEDRHVRAIDSRVSRVDLRGWYGRFGPCLIASRIPPSGHLQLGSENTKSGRSRGVYSFREELAGRPFLARIGQDGVATGFHFAGENEPLGLRIIVRKDSHGNLIEAVESHILLIDYDLHELIKELGSFWIQGDGLRVEKARSEEGRGDVGASLSVGAKNIPATGEVIYFNYDLPPQYAKKKVEVLIGEGGVPAFIRVEGGSNISALNRFLIRLEIRNEAGHKLEEVIESCYGNATKRGISRALSIAAKTGSLMAVTRLPVLRSREGNSCRVHVAGQAIGIPASLAKTLPQDPQDLYAEVIYIPSPSTSRRIPPPAFVRVGVYDSQDPFNEAAWKFRVLDEYSLRPSKKNQNVYIAVKPNQPRELSGTGDGSRSELGTVPPAIPDLSPKGGKAPRERASTSGAEAVSEGAGLIISTRGQIDAEELRIAEEIVKHFTPTQYEKIAVYFAPFLKYRARVTGRKSLADYSSALLSQEDSRIGGFSEERRYIRKSIQDSLWSLEGNSLTTPISARAKTTLPFYIQPLVEKRQKDNDKTLIIKVFGCGREFPHEIKEVLDAIAKTRLHDREDWAIDIYVYDVKPGNLSSVEETLLRIMTPFRRLSLNFRYCDLKDGSQYDYIFDEPCDIAVYRHVWDVSDLPRSDPNFRSRLFANISNNGFLIYRAYGGRDEIFTHKGHVSAPISNPFPNLKSDSGLTLADLFWDGFKGKAEMSTLANGGPIWVPPFVIFKREDKTRRKGDIDSLMGRDQGHYPYLIDESRLVKFEEFVRDRVLSARGPLGYVYKPNSGNVGYNIFFLEKDTDGRVTLTMAWNGGRTIEKVYPRMRTMLGDENARVYEDQDIAQFTLSGDMGKEEMLKAISSLWGMIAKGGDLYDPGMMQEMVPTIKYRQDKREFAYETRHFVRGAIRRIAPFITILEDRDEPITSAGDKGPFAKIGSSRYFANQSGRNRYYAHELKGDNIYNPLLAAYPYLTEPKAKRRFKRYVDGLLTKEFDYLRRRLLKAGIVIDEDLVLEIDLQWLPPESYDSFPIPVVIESNFKTPGRIEMRNPIKYDAPIPNAFTYRAARWLQGEGRQSSSGEATRSYMGSPEGLGKASGKGPDIANPIHHRALTRDSKLEEKTVRLEGRIGSGLGSIVYKGTCDGKPIVEKFTGDIPGEGRLNRFARRLMLGMFLLFRQALPSYRTNYYAAMTNHYANLVIEDASWLEFGESIAPRLEYTSYDEASGGYVVAYEFIDGRHIRPGPEEKILKENLKRWSEFLGSRLGFWGLARQCDPNNVNSPSNVYVVDEDTKKMKLIDTTPAVLGGQIWFLPLELKYFFRGIATGRFLPFGDAVDIKVFNEYSKDAAFRLSTNLEDERLRRFQRNCRRFRFYLNRWRNSEPMLLRSPFRIFSYLFDRRTIKSTLRTLAANLEYEGVINKKAADYVRFKTRTENSRVVLTAIRISLAAVFARHILRNLPRSLYKAGRFIIVEMPVKAVKSLSNSIRFVTKVYFDSEYRRRVTSQKVEEWIDRAENIDKRISHTEAQTMRGELEQINILDVLQLYPLWGIAKIIKPPFIGTAANIALVYLLITTLNPYYLIPLFFDGFIRGAIAVLFTGLKYKTLLALSLLPTIGPIMSIPTQTMRAAPHLTKFLMNEVIASGIGASLPGIDRHSFRVYFYIHLMGIPVYLIKTIAWLVNLFPGAQPSAPSDIDMELIKREILKTREEYEGFGHCVMHSVELARRLIKCGINAQVSGDCHGCHYWVEMTDEDGYIIDAYPEGLGAERRQAELGFLGDERFIIVKKGSDIAERLYPGSVEETLTKRAKAYAKDEPALYKDRAAYWDASLRDRILSLSLGKISEEDIDKNEGVIRLRARLRAARQRLEEAQDMTKKEAERPVSRDAAPLDAKEGDNRRSSSGEKIDGTALRGIGADVLGGLLSRKKSYGFVGIGKGDVEAREEVFATDEIKPNSKLWRNAYSGFKDYALYLYRKFMRIYSYEAPIAHHRKGSSALGVVDANPLSIHDGEERDGSARVDIGLRLKPLSLSIKGKFYNRARVFFINLVRKYDPLSHWMRKRMEEKSLGFGTGMPVGFPYFLVISLSIFAMGSLALIGNILPPATKIYGYLPPYLSTIISKCSLIHLSLSALFFFALISTTSIAKYIALRNKSQEGNEKSDAGDVSERAASQGEGRSSASGARPKAPALLSKRELMMRLKYLPKESWYSRTAAIRLKDGSIQAMKFLKAGEDESILEEEAKMMRRMRDKGIDAPMPVKRKGGSYVFTYKGALPNAPPEVAWPHKYITYITSPEYFVYPEDIKDKDTMRRLALNSIRKLAQMHKLGYLHTSLSPLTHAESSNRKWRWNYDPIGGIENLSENLTHSNIRLKGLADFSHAARIIPTDYLHYEFGQALSEWAITITYHSLKNGLKTEDVLLMLKDGFSAYLGAFKLRNNIADERLDNLRKFIRLFKKEYVKDELSSKDDGDIPTIDNLTPFIKAVLNELEGSPRYKELKSNSLQVEDIAEGSVSNPQAKVKDGDILCIADYNKECIVKIPIPQKKRPVSRDAAPNKERESSSGFPAGFTPELGELYFYPDKNYSLLSGRWICDGEKIYLIYRAIPSGRDPNVSMIVLENGGSRLVKKDKKQISGWHLLKNADRLPTLSPHERKVEPRKYMILKNEIDDSVLGRHAVYGVINYIFSEGNIMVHWFDSRRVADDCITRNEWRDVPYRVVQFNMRDSSSGAAEHLQGEGKGDGVKVSRIISQTFEHIQDSRFRQSSSGTLSDKIQALNDADNARERNKILSDIQKYLSADSPPGLSDRDMAQAFKQLVKGLKHYPDPESRIACAQVIAVLGLKKDYVKAALEAAQEDEPEERVKRVIESCLKALFEIKDKTRPPAVSHKETSARPAMVERLAAVERPAAVRPAPAASQPIVQPPQDDISRLVDNITVSLDEDAAVGLAGLEDRGISALKGLLNREPDLKVKETAAFGLVRAAGKGPRTLLGALFNSPSCDIKRAAAYALAANGAYRMLESVLSRAKDYETKEIVCMSLGRSGREGGKLLSSALRDEDINTRRAATIGLMESGGPEFDELRKAIRNPSAEIRKKAFEELVKRDLSAFSILKGALNFPDDEDLRNRAASAIAQFGDAGFNMLDGASHSPDEGVRLSAGRVLEGIRNTPRPHRDAKGVPKGRGSASGEKNLQDILPEGGAIYHSTRIGIVRLIILESKGMLSGCSFFAFKYGNAVGRAKSFEGTPEDKTTSITLAFDVNQLRQHKIGFEEFLSTIIHLRAVDSVPLSALTDESKKEVVRELLKLAKEGDRWTIDTKKIASALGFESWDDLNKALFPKGIGNSSERGSASGEAANRQSSSGEAADAGVFPDLSSMVSPSSMAPDTMAPVLGIEELKGLLPYLPDDVLICCTRAEKLEQIDRKGDRFFSDAMRVTFQELKSASSDADLSQAVERLYALLKSHINSCIMWSTHNPPGRHEYKRAWKLAFVIVEDKRSLPGLENENVLQRFYKIYVGSGTGDNQTLIAKVPSRYIEKDYWDRKCDMDELARQVIEPIIRNARLRRDQKVESALVKGDVSENGSTAGKERNSSSGVSQSDTSPNTPEPSNADDSKMGRFIDWARRLFEAVNGLEAKWQAVISTPVGERDKAYQEFLQALEPAESIINAIFDLGLERNELEAIFHYIKYGIADTALTKKNDIKSLITTADDLSSLSTAQTITFGIGQLTASLKLFKDFQRIVYVVSGSGKIYLNVEASTSSDEPEKKDEDPAAEAPVDRSAGERGSASGDTRGTDRSGPSQTDASPSPLQATKSQQGKILKEIRRSIGLNQTEFGRLLNPSKPIPQGTISNWERGASPILQDILLRAEGLVRQKTIQASKAQREPFINPQVSETLLLPTQAVSRQQVIDKINMAKTSNEVLGVKQRARRTTVRSRFRRLLSWLKEGLLPGADANTTKALRRLISAYSDLTGGAKPKRAKSGKRRVYQSMEPVTYPSRTEAVLIARSNPSLLKEALKTEDPGLRLEDIMEDFLKVSEASDAWRRGMCAKYSLFSYNLNERILTGERLLSAYLFKEGEYKKYLIWKLKNGLPMTEKQQEAIGILYPAVKPDSAVYAAGKVGTVKGVDLRRIPLWKRISLIGSLESSNREAVIRGYLPEFVSVRGRYGKPVQLLKLVNIYEDLVRRLIECNTKDAFDREVANIAGKTSETNLFRVLTRLFAYLIDSGGISLVGLPMRSAEENHGDDSLGAATHATEEFYDSPLNAKDYADIWDRDVQKAVQVNRETFLSRLPPNGMVLDVGTGSARDAVWFKEHGRKAIGIDKAQAMLNEARERHPEIALIKMDMRKLAFSDEKMAGIWGNAAIIHLTPEQAQQAILEFYRVLMEDGILFIRVKRGDGETIDPKGRYTKLYQKSELESLVSSAGFKIISTAIKDDEATSTQDKRGIEWVDLFAIKSNKTSTGNTSSTVGVVSPGTASQEVEKEGRKSSSGLPTNRTSADTTFVSNAEPLKGGMFNEGVYERGAVHAGKEWRLLSLRLRLPEIPIKFPFHLPPSSSGLIVTPKLMTTIIVMTITILIGSSNFIKSAATSVANNIFPQSSKVWEIALRLPWENIFIIALSIITISLIVKAIIQLAELGTGIIESTEIRGSAQFSPDVRKITSNEAKRLGLPPNQVGGTAPDAQRKLRKQLAADASADGVARKAPSPGESGDVSESDTPPGKGRNSSSGVSPSDTVKTGGEIKPLFGPFSVNRELKGKSHTYRVIKPLKEGGMSFVYEAEDMVARERVALKVNRFPYLSQDDPYKKQFEREIKILGVLSDRGCDFIPRLRDWGIEPMRGGDCGWFAMDMIDGTDIMTWAWDNKNPGKVLSVMRQIFDALIVLHRNGIAHRDLKTAHIIIDREGKVKLIDFGIARSDDGEFKRDVFGMGAMMFELALGRDPILEPGESDHIFTQEDVETKLQEAGAQSWVKFAGVISRAIAKDSEKRFQDIEEMKAAFDDVFTNTSLNSAESSLSNGAGDVSKQREAVIGSGPLGDRGLEIGAGTEALRLSPEPSLEMSLNGKLRGSASGKEEARGESEAGQIKMPAAIIQNSIRLNKEINSRIKNGDLQKAESLLSEVEGLIGTNRNVENAISQVKFVISGYTNLVQACIKRGNLKRAEVYFKKAFQLFSTSVSMESSVVNQAPHVFRICYILIDQYIKRQSYEEAKEILQMILPAFPDYAPIVRIDFRNLEEAVKKHMESAAAGRGVDEREEVLTKPVVEDKEKTPSKTVETEPKRQKSGIPAHMDGLRSALREERPDEVQRLLNIIIPKMEKAAKKGNPFRDDYIRLVKKAQAMLGDIAPREGRGSEAPAGERGSASGARDVSKRDTPQSRESSNGVPTSGMEEKLSSFIEEDEDEVYDDDGENKQIGNEPIIHGSELSPSPHGPEKHDKGQYPGQNIKSQECHFSAAPNLDNLPAMTRKTIVIPIPAANVSHGTLPEAFGTKSPTTKEPNNSFAPSRKKSENVVNSSLDIITPTQNITLSLLESQVLKGNRKSSSGAGDVSGQERYNRSGEDGLAQNGSPSSSLDSRNQDAYTSRIAGLPIKWAGEFEKQGLRVALVQIKEGKFNENTQRMADIVNGLSKLGKDAPDLVVFPEMVDKVMSLSSSDKTRRIETLKAIVGKSKIAVGFGIGDIRNSVRLISYYIIQPGENGVKVRRYKKGHIRQEKRKFSIKGHKVAILICIEASHFTDFDVSDMPWNIKTADLLIIPAYVFPQDGHMWVRALRDEFKMPVAFINLAHKHTHGKSALISSKSETILSSKDTLKEEAILIANISKEGIAPREGPAAEAPAGERGSASGEAANRKSSSGTSPNAATPPASSGSTGDVASGMLSVSVLLDCLEEGEVEVAFNYFTNKPGQLESLSNALSNDRTLEGKNTQKIHQNLVKLYAKLLFRWAGLPDEEREKSLLQPRWHHLPEMLGREGITLTPEVFVDIYDLSTVYSQNLLTKICFEAGLNKAGIGLEERNWIYQWCTFKDETLEISDKKFETMRSEAKRIRETGDRPKIEVVVGLYQASVKMREQLDACTKFQVKREIHPNTIMHPFVFTFGIDYLLKQDSERCEGYWELQKIICPERFREKYPGSEDVLSIRMKDFITKYPQVTTQIAPEFAEVVLAEPQQTQKFCEAAYALKEYGIWDEFVRILGSKGGTIDVQSGLGKSATFSIRFPDDAKGDVSKGDRPPEERRKSSSGEAADAGISPDLSSRVSRSSMAPKIAALHAMGFELLKDVTKLNHDLSYYKIPVDVDSLPCVNDDNIDILRNLLEILAMKQLILNRKYGPNRVIFEFVKRNNSCGFEPVKNHLIPTLYSELKIVHDNHLYAPVARNDYNSSFLIAVKANIPESYYDTRVLALDKRIALDNNAEFVMWNTVLDIAVAQTILLGQSEETRKAYYGRLSRLYSDILGQAVDESKIEKLLRDDIKESIFMALQLAVPTCGRFRINELRELYQKMRDLAWQA